MRDSKPLGALDTPSCLITTIQRPLWSQLLNKNLLMSQMHPEASPLGCSS